ncbi:MAG: galactose-1-phosphate uridylyltransferase [Desulfobacterales bacterium]
MKSVIRQDKALNRWVIFSTLRGKRPHEFKKKTKRAKSLPEYDLHCPFCPGNEHMLDEILLQDAGDNSYGWQTRVVPNKYPALLPEGNTHRREEGIYLSMDGYGRHEVIIESPGHRRQIALLPPEAVRKVIEVYHRRYVQLMETNENSFVVIFRNHGPGAGTSLIHPHSQIIATGIVPGYVRFREDQAQRYYDTWGRCVYCEMLAFEAQEGTRVLEENDTFLAFIPFAAEVPFEIWILPKCHQADFGTITETEKDRLAEMMGRLLKNVYEKLNDPDYNYIIRTAPRYKSGEPHLHWFLQIRPRLTMQAGFEIGSGISINPSLPEQDAEYLRSASA